MLPVELHTFCTYFSSGIAYILLVELHTFCQWNCVHLCQFSLCCNCTAWGWKWSPSFCSLDCGFYVASSSSRNSRFMSCHVHWCWYSQAVQCKFVVSGMIVIFNLVQRVLGSVTGSVVESQVADEIFLCLQDWWDCIQLQWWQGFYRVYQKLLPCLVPLVFWLFHS